MSKNSIVDFISEFPKVKLEVTAADLKDFAANLLVEIRREFEVEKEKANLDITEVLLDPEAVKVRLGISSTTLWRWGKKKLLVPINVGGIVKYRLSDVNRLMTN